MWLLPALLAAQDEGLEVRELEFKGNKAIDATVLSTSIATSNSSWIRRSGLTRWMGLGQKKYLDERELQRDVLRLEILYRRSGFPSATVDTLVRRDSTSAWITFEITEGLPILTRSIEFTGLDSLTTANRLLLTNNENLASLAGAPLLTTVYSLTAIANPKLTQAAIDTFVSQLDQPPDGCSGDWDQCTCFEFLPW